MIILFFISTLFAITPDQVTCPPGTGKVDYSFGGKRYVSCQKNVDGKYVDVGEKYEFSESGEQIVQGVKELPKLSNTEEQSLDQAAKNISKLMRILMPAGSEAEGTENFAVRLCDRSHMSGLFKVAMLNKPLPVAYKFKHACDVNGAFAIKRDDPFPVVMKLRRLGHFSDVKFMMTIRVLPTDKGLIFTFTATEGELRGEPDVVTFEGSYKMLLTAAGGKATSQNEGGSITVLKMNGKDVNKTQDIFID